jgi:ABC-2 type transport system ATP-binding protein
VILEPSRPGWKRNASCCQTSLSEMSSGAIETFGLTRDYSEVRALDSLSLRVEVGEIFGFLGPNGAGKTTTIRLLLDLIRPTAGRAAIMGFDCQRQSLETRRRTGYLPGDLNLYEGMNGDAFLNFFASLQPDRIDPAYRNKLVERIDLDLSKSARALSKGNRQKLGIVQALMHRPEVLILDEPTAGLDPLVQHEVLHILEDVAAEGRSVFFSSHILSEVERICHRVGIIRSGRLVTVEDVAKLRQRSFSILEVTFAEPVPEDLFDLPGVEVVSVRDSTVRMHVRRNLDEVVKRAARSTVVGLHTEQPSLEDVFLAYYEEPTKGQRA